jgi:uncharacterized repeat protein (TIGR02543 family)
MQIKRIHIKKRSLFAFLSLGLMAFMSIGVGAVLYSQPTSETKADAAVSYGLNIYVSATGNDSTGKGTLAEPYATCEKAFSAMQGNSNICLLSDIMLSSASSPNGNNLSWATISQKYNALITSADPKTGNILTNAAGTFGDTSTNNKVYTIYRGTSSSFYQYNFFFINQPSGWNTTFRNIIMDGCSLQHYQGNNGTLIFWGNGGGSIVLSTNCVLKNNYAYIAGGNGAVGAAIYSEGTSSLTMEDNATIRNCVGNNSGSVLRLEGSSSTFDNHNFIMKDDAIITGCGTRQTEGNAMVEGTVIRSDINLIMSGNAQIVNNFSILGVKPSDTLHSNAVCLRGHGGLFSGNVKICNNYYRYYSGGVLSDYIDGNLYNLSKTGLYVSDALGVNAKIQFAPETALSPSTVVAKRNNASYTLVDADADAFHYDGNTATTGSSYYLTVNSSAQTIVATSMANATTLGSPDPIVSSREGPISIIFATPKPAAITTRAIAVRIDDDITLPSEIASCTYDSSSGSLLIETTKKISSTSKVKVRVLVNGYLINSNAWIDVTNSIPYTVSFVSNGGSRVDDVSVTKGAACTKPSDPAQPGYVFQYWCIDSSLTTGYDFNTILVNDISLYAKWTQIEKLSALILSVDYSVSRITGFDVEKPSQFDNYYSLNQDMSSKVKITNPYLDIDESWYGLNVYFQKISNSSYYYSSDVLALSIVPHGVAPAAGTVTDPAFSGDTGSLVVLSTQEYSTDNGKTWTVGTGVAIAFASGSVVLVRTAATTSVPYSKSTSVTIRTKLATPVLTANYATSILSGLTDGYAYSVTVGGVSNADIPSNNGGSYSFPVDLDWQNRQDHDASERQQPRDRQRSFRFESD